MSLKMTGDKVPQNAVKLTKQEAIFYQWKQLKHWPDRWDVWPYLFGVPGMTLLAGFSALKMNKHYRMKLKLRSYGIASTQLAVGLTPAILAMVPHFLFVSEQMFIDNNLCILCHQTHAIAIQLFSSVIYPSVISPIANCMFATRHGTYQLPYWQDWKGLLQLWYSLNRTLLPKMKIIIPLHIIAAGFITYAEAKSLHKIRARIDNGDVESLPEIDFL